MKRSLDSFRTSKYCSSDIVELLDTLAHHRNRLGDFAEPAVNAAVDILIALRPTLPVAVFYRGVTFASWAGAAQRVLSDEGVQATLRDKANFLPPRPGSLQAVAEARARGASSSSAEAAPEAAATATDDTILPADTLRLLWGCVHCSPTPLPPSLLAVVDYGVLLGIGGGHLPGRRLAGLVGIAASGGHFRPALWDAIVRGVVAQVDELSVSDAVGILIGFGAAGRADRRAFAAVAPLLKREVGLMTLEQAVATAVEFIHAGIPDAVLINAPLEKLAAGEVASTPQLRALVAAFAPRGPLDGSLLDAIDVAVAAQVAGDRLRLETGNVTVSSDADAAADGFETDASFFVEDEIVRLAEFSLRADRKEGAVFDYCASLVEHGASTSRAFFSALEVVGASGALAANPALAAAAMRRVQELIATVGVDVSGLCHLASAMAAAGYDTAALWALRAIITSPDAAAGEAETAAAVAAMRALPAGALVAGWRALCAVEDTIHAAGPPTETPTETADEDGAEVPGQLSAEEAEAQFGPIRDALAASLEARAGELSLSQSLIALRALLPSCVRSTVRAQNLFREAAIAAAEVAEAADDDTDYKRVSADEPFAATLCPHGPVLDALAIRMLDFVATAAPNELATILAYAASAAAWRPPNVPIAAFETFAALAVGERDAAAVAAALRKSQEGAEKAAAASFRKEVKGASRPAEAFAKAQAAQRAPFAAFASEDVVALLSSVVSRLVRAGATCAEAPLLALCRIAPKIAEDSRIPMPPSELMTRAEDLFGAAPATALRRPYASQLGSQSASDLLHARNNFVAGFLRERGLNSALSHPRGIGAGFHALQDVERNSGRLFTSATNTDRDLLRMAEDLDASKQSTQANQRAFYERTGRLYPHPRNPV